MKQRMISAAVALVILAGVFAFYETFVLNIAVSLVSAMAVFELLHATGYVKSKALLVFSLGYALVVPFFSTLRIHGMQVYVTLGYFILMFGSLLLYHTDIRFEEVAISFFISLVVPTALSSIVLMRDRYSHGILYVLLCCVAAWISDSCAYFTGRAFGRHKMAPLISPHKTIEGAIGGVVGCCIFFMLTCFCYQQYQLHLHGVQMVFSWGTIAVISIFCSLVSIVGDLMASVVKRQTGIKDFGKIMPGHGGVMDRFDSFLFVAPTIYLILQYFPIMTIVN